MKTWLWRIFQMNVKPAFFIIKLFMARRICWKIFQESVKHLNKDFFEKLWKPLRSLQETSVTVLRKIFKIVQDYAVSQDLLGRSTCRAEKYHHRRAPSSENRIHSNRCTFYQSGSTNRFLRWRQFCQFCPLLWRFSIIFFKSYPFWCRKAPKNLFP